MQSTSGRPSSTLPGGRHIVSPQSGNGQLGKPGNQRMHQHTLPSAQYTQHMESSACKVSPHPDIRRCSGQHACASQHLNVRTKSLYVAAQLRPMGLEGVLQWQDVRVMSFSSHVYTDAPHMDACDSLPVNSRQAAALDTSSCCVQRAQCTSSNRTYAAYT